MITYGFELMLNRESAHNLFRLLECRDIDQNALKTVIFYFACGLHPFVLNREAKNYEFVRFLVDGSHWNAPKKLKCPDSSGKGGHVGCSEG